MNSTIKKLNEAKDYIFKKIPNEKITTAITLGSGLGLFCDSLTEKIEIPYANIPHFFAPSVVGHEGKLVFGKCEGKNVLVYQGRIHAYEGHSMEEVVFPTRLVKTLGIKNLILTNASGGMNKDFKPGDLVIIKDHINLTGQNPLLGKNIDELGPRFPDMGNVWNRELRYLLKDSAEKLGYILHQGIYMGVLGPSYETPAEIRMYNSLGADMVGMSTVPEAIAGHHVGLKLCGLSCITNMAAGLHEGELNHEDIKEEANKVKGIFVTLLKEFIKKL